MANIQPDERDRLSPVWDLSQERAFMEQLLSQRFNFFLVFFALTIGGAMNSRSQSHLQIILALGTLISWMLSFTLFRAQQKVNIILGELFKDPTHPAAFANSRAKPFPSARNLIGYWVPAICSLALLIGAILSFIHMIVVPILH